MPYLHDTVRPDFLILLFIYFCLRLGRIWSSHKDSVSDYRYCTVSNGIAVCRNCSAETDGQQDTRDGQYDAGNCKG